MNILYAEYNIHHNSIDIATTVGYILRIDCWEAEKDLRTTPCSEYALNTLAIDDPLEYARLYLKGNMQMWIDVFCIVKWKILWNISMMIIFFDYQKFMDQDALCSCGGVCRILTLCPSR